MSTTSAFSSLLKQSASKLDKLAKEMASMAKNKRQDDERFWKINRDKIGNGLATIRFLPAPEGEDVPFIRVWTHGFRGPGGWYFENSRTTIGETDPVSELNSRLWEEGDRGQEIARKQKRKLTYISNVYVVKDPSNTENEGKVFLFKYGKKIFDKLNERMSPQFQDEEPMNPFDLLTGANFKLKVTDVEGFPNYDKSTFESPSALLNGDVPALEKIWRTEYKLQPFLAPDQFKPYTVLKARLEKVLARPEVVIDHTEDGADTDEEQDSGPKYSTKKGPPVAAAPKTLKAAADPLEENDGNTNNLKFFEDLAEGDN